MLQNNNPLSPIILSKLYSTEEKIDIKAKLNRDIFNIYQIKNAVSKNGYCKQISNYLSNNKRSVNSYYKCDNCDEKVNTTYNNNYIVIEFNKPTSTFTVDNIEYIVRKITFHTPTYHTVNNEKNYNNNEFPSKSDQKVDRHLDTSDSFIKNCLEIEILCETLVGSLLSISILCNTDKNDNYDTKNIDGFTENNGIQRPFFGLIYRYIISNDKQLFTGGFLDKKRQLDLHDLLPFNKHFFKYNGTLFQTTPIGNQDVTNVNRIVFKNSISIPYIFFNRIQNLITHSSSSCGNGRQLNQFIDYKPEHNLIFSDNNIDFPSNNFIRKKKKISKFIIAIIIILVILLFLIAISWLWGEGILQNTLKEAFQESDTATKLFDTLKI